MYELLPLIFSGLFNISFTPYEKVSSLSFILVSLLVPEKLKSILSFSSNKLVKLVVKITPIISEMLI